MLTFVTIVHVVLCVFMIFVILLQPGKDAGMGAALGGGAATSAFGGRGAVTFLRKLTGICAAGFFITALGLSFVGLRTSVAAGEDDTNPPAQAVPAAGGAIDGGTSTGPSTGLEQPAAGATTPAAPAAPAAPAEAAPPAPGTPPATPPSSLPISPAAEQPKAP